jgi:hypothetical protein
MFEMIFVLLIKIKVHLFGRKSYFTVFDAIENKNQIENIFGLTKIASLVSKNDFHF